MNKSLRELEMWATIILIFLFPIITLPISTDVFSVPKLIILAFGISFLILVRIVRIVTLGKAEFQVGSFDIAVVIIMVAYGISAYFKTPNKMEAFLLPGTATAMIGGGLLYFFINQIASSKRKLIEYALVVSATIFSILMILPATGALTGLTGSFAYFGVRTFSPAGGYLPAAIFLVAIAPIAIGTILSQKDIINKVAWTLTGIVMLFGLGLSIYNITPGQPFSSKLPTYNTDWNITIDSIKESPLMGVGPGNYLTAFNRYRPISYNSTDLWAIKFTTARSHYMTMITETGLIGLVGILITAFVIYKLVKSNLKQRGTSKTMATNMLSLLLLVLLLVAFPASATLLVLSFILMSINNQFRKTAFNMTAKSDSDGIGNRWPAVVLALPIIILTIAFLFRASRVVAAEYKFRKAIEAVARNEAIVAYDTIRDAIATNPLVDRYHSIYAQINLALANSIAAQANEEGELADDQREQITLLMQQSIREARATVALNPLRAGNWIILARTYQSIIPLAKGADVFSAQSYAQAVALDPTNPSIRIALGGLYYGAGNYESAVKVFELATVTKRDHANARYNLAYALKDVGQIERAIQEMTIVLGLLVPGAPDHTLAKTALEEFQSVASDLLPQAGEELTAPEDQGKIIQPPVELGEGDKPPENVVSPTPIEIKDGDSEPSITPQISPTPIP